MAIAILTKKEHSTCCDACGQFGFDTRDIGHLHYEGEVSCLGCQYPVKCPTCDTIVYVGKQLFYIDLSALFIRRSAIIDGDIVTYTLELDKE